MDNENKSINVGPQAILIAFILSVIVAVSVSWKSISFENQRVKCNQTVFADKKLSEDRSGSIFFFEGPSTTAEQVDARLVETNKEVNRLRSLMGCYFDK